jgi:hypothetical protein
MTVITNLNFYVNRLKKFIKNNKGATKPNCINNDSIPYYVYENAIVDGIWPLNTTDDTIISMLESFVISGEYTLLQTMVDYLLDNGFKFTRATYVPGGYIYTEGESPYILLRFSIILRRLYYYTGTTSYLTDCNAILARLKTNMTIPTDTLYPDYSMPTAFLLYDSGALLTTYRSGTYAQDVNPLAWLMDNNSISAYKAVQFIADSQASFKINFKIDSLFMPFYIRNLPENATYTPPLVDNWSFGGPIGDELNLKHSYQTGYNLAKYYHHKVTFYDGRKDNTAKIVLKKYLDFLKAFYDTNLYIPTDIIGIEIMDWSSEDTFFDSEVETFDMLYKETITWGHATVSIRNLALVALASFYTYKVERDSEYLKFAEDILTEILTYVQSDGSFSIGGTTYLEDQSLVLELLYAYQNRNSRTYLELINEALALINLVGIYPPTYLTNPSKVSLSLATAGMTEITTKRFWDWCYKETSLIYSGMTGSYDLTTLDINRHRIETVEFVYNNHLYELPEINYETYLEWISPYGVGVIDWADEDITLDSEFYTFADSTYYACVGMPQYYAIRNNTIYLYPGPDIDYGLYIGHYDEVTNIQDYLQYPELLPIAWQFVLRWYIAFNLSTILQKYFSPLFSMFYELTLAALEYCEVTDIKEERVMPSNMDLSGLDSGWENPYVY